MEVAAEEQVEEPGSVGQLAKFGTSLLLSKPLVLDTASMMEGQGNFLGQHAIYRRYPRLLVQYLPPCCSKPSLRSVPRSKS